MYYYSDKFDANVENIISDFIKCKKSNNTKGVQQTVDTRTKAEETNDILVEYKNVKLDPKLWEPETIPYKKEQKKVNIEFSDADMKDFNYLTREYSSLNKIFATHIHEILIDLDFQNSPIYKTEISKELLEDIIESSLKKCSENIEEIQIICSQENHSIYSPQILLRSIFEFMILNEIFLLRRIKERKLKNYETYMTL